MNNSLHSNEHIGQHSEQYTAHICIYSLIDIGEEKESIGLYNYALKYKL